MRHVSPPTGAKDDDDEIDHILTWAAENNLMLNCSTSKEIIFTARGKRGKSVQLPSPCLDIERVSSLRVLGVIVNDQLTATDHVSNILASCLPILVLVWQFERFFWYMQLSAPLIRITDLAQSWHPSHFATWCLSCYRRREVDLLRTIVVRCMLCRRPC